MCGVHSIIILTFQMYFFIFVDEENSMDCVISQNDVKVELLKMDYIELSSKFFFGGGVGRGGTAFDVLFCACT